MAVLTPMTSAREFSSGPPELPGLSAASVWITSGMVRPLCARMLRPSALTMPAVTVCSKPSGLPMAMAISPRFSPAERPSGACVRLPLDTPSMCSTARSVSGSSPTKRALNSRPSSSETWELWSLGRAGRPARTTCELLSR